MKTIIAGGRDIIDMSILKNALSSIDFKITEVVCGLARGADLLGEEWASKKEIPVKYFPAKWHLYGKSAGYKRNNQMAEYADCLIALWDGKSKGTSHMINLAKENGLNIYIEYIK